MHLNVCVCVPVWCWRTVAPSPSEPPAGVVPTESEWLWSGAHCGSAADEAPLNIHTYTLIITSLTVPSLALFYLKVLLVSSLALRPSWPSRLSLCSSLAFSALSSLTRRSVGLSFTTARFWIRFALKRWGRYRWTSWTEGGRGMRQKKTTSGLEVLVCVFYDGVNLMHSCIHGGLHG